MGLGHSIGNFDPFSQPLDLEITEVFDFRKAVHSAKHGTDGHEENLTEMMELVATGISSL